MVIIEGTIRVDDIEKARPYMEKMIQASRAEEGCIDYSYAVDITDPTLIRVTERWENRNTLAEHLNSKHLAEWRTCWSKTGVHDRSLRMYEADAEAV